MRLTQCSLIAIAMTVILSPTTQATPILVPVDASSSISVELCISGNCDTDASSVSGSAWIKLAPTTSPTEISLYDFSFVLDNPINIYISWSFLGSFSATGNGLTLSYATPFAPMPPTAVAGAAFSYANVPSNATGIVSYSASGIPCIALEQTGKPCNDAMDMGDQGTQNGDMDGTVSVSPSRVVTFMMNPDVTSPLDPDNPGLGAISMTGTISGQATIPLRGDANLDGSVDAGDVQDFLNVLLDPDSFGWQPRFAVDMNDDDAFDLDDADLFITCLLGDSCPD